LSETSFNKLLLSKFFKIVATLSLFPITISRLKDSTYAWRLLPTIVHICVELTRITPIRKSEHKIRLATAAIQAKRLSLLLTNELVVSTTAFSIPFGKGQLHKLNRSF